MPGQIVRLVLMGVAGPLILFIFMILFQADSYQYWGDRYHSVLTSQFLFSRLQSGSLLGPLWREDVLSGNIWLVSLGTVPFMVDIVAARLLQLSPFGIDLVGNLLGYAVAVPAMYLYLRRAMAVTPESATVSAVLFAASAYVLSVWTGCANDFFIVGSLPALLVISHTVKDAAEQEGDGAVVLPLIGLVLLTFLSAAGSSVKTLPILLTLVAAYAGFVFKLGRATLWIMLGLVLGLALYAPWFWLYWDAARISQRLESAFVPAASFDAWTLLSQALVLAKRMASGFNVYGVSMPVILVLLVYLLCRHQEGRREDPKTRAILQFAVLGLVACLVMDVFALQINDLKRSLPYVTGFDVVRFEWFGSFFSIALAAWVLDRGIFRPGAWAFTLQNTRRVRYAVIATALLFALQAGHWIERSVQVPSSIYPQNLVLQVCLGLAIVAGGLVLVLVYRGWDTESHRQWCAGLISLAVLFQSSVIAYRHGVESTHRTSGDEPIMSYAERFSVPDDLSLLKELNRSGDRVVDLTRPYGRLLSAAAGTALPWTGLRTSVGYSNLVPGWYQRFIARGVNGERGSPTRWVDVHAGPQTNFGALQLLGVKYLVAYDGAELPGYTPVLRHEPTGRRIYAGEGKPAFVSPQVACVSNEDDALEAIHAADYKTLISRAILVSSDPPAQALCRRHAVSESPAQARGPLVTIKRGNDRVNLEVDSESGGLLTLADTYYPGWQAYVDGVEVPIVRSYTTFRGVMLRPGPHAVEFVFAPTPFWMLLSLSNGLLVAMVVVSVWMLRRRFRSAGQVTNEALAHR